jgi:enhancing lycopene biosynthesis protein 2
MNKSKKIALVLSGCGNKDGSEITEAVSLIVALTQTGAEVHGFAPDIETPEKDHHTGEKTGLKRNALREAARILRGHATDLKKLKAQDFDALCFAGGMGAALVLSDWADKGAACSVLPEVRQAIVDFYSQSKPIGAVCIAPVLLARVLGEKKIELTLGAAENNSADLKKTGAQHVTCPVNDFITDRDHKIITSPAYMYDATPAEVFEGISGLAKELVEMA